MAQALHIRLRKKLNQWSHRLLSKLYPMDKNPVPIELKSIKKILVVRINYRIGNILFTTPLLNALEKQFPHAQIDVMIGAPFIAPLIEKMPQINTVYSFPRELLKQPFNVLKLKKELKNNNYDLLVTPSLHSSSDSFFTFLVSARYKVGFYSPDTFSPLTHGIEFPSTIEHEALKPLALMSAFGAEDINSFKQYMDLQLSQAEKEKNATEALKGSIGIFRDARNEKKIEDYWWKELIQALRDLDNNLKFIDILDPNNKTPLQKNIPTLSEKNLRILASKIGNLDAFICGDTGPMHLASATLTPTIALFKATSPSLYGTLGERDLSLEMQEKSIEEIAKEILSHLRKKA